MADRTVLWWGRFDPDYSRNRIIRQLLSDLGWRIGDFRPILSAAGDVEATLRGMPAPALVWVPCFRQRDAGAAARWAKRCGVPMIFDPLISAWDKQVFERGKIGADGLRSRRLRKRESALFAAADLVLIDTELHGEFFKEAFGLEPGRVAVVPVGAEEPLFHPAPMRPLEGRPVEVLFYGSFIGLHGPECIVEAARLYDGPPVRWTLLGDGPHRTSCERLAEGLETVSFEPWDPYTERPSRIHRADILLGVFGTSAKAGRVIANKVYQSLACGRPVITRESRAYPEKLRTAPDPGLAQIPAGDPGALAATVRDWASDPAGLAGRGGAAADLYGRYFGTEAIKRALREALDRVLQ